MSFSKGLVLTELDDYLSPSQACIKPVETKPGAGEGEGIGLPRTVIQIDGASGDYFEVDEGGARVKLEEASINLTDCLACSGCITSAETVLVQMQSHFELYKVLEANAQCSLEGRLEDKRTVVVSLAPQTVASFMAKYNLTFATATQKLVGFLKTLGVGYVFDVSLARDVSLVESAREFLNRYGSHHKVYPAGSQPTQTVPSDIKEPVRPRVVRRRNPLPNSQPPLCQELPMLASACPGWICYAEKTHGQLLPYVAATKSPQQIMGTMVKTYFASRNELRPDQIYHVAVMPCYDKKLEASREDFYSDIYSTRDVDCVLTTGEIEKMLSERNLTGEGLPELPLSIMDSIFTSASSTFADEVQFTCPDEPSWMEYGRIPSQFSLTTSASGGYLEFIMMAAAHYLFGRDLTNHQQLLHASDPTQQGPLTIRTVRNADFREVILEDDQGNPQLKFAAAYGFRNLQNIVRKLKSDDPATPSYHYIEVMACPSGCINGGGQLKSDSLSAKVWVQTMRKAYSHIKDAHIDSIGQSDSDVPPVIPPPHTNPWIRRLYLEWLNISDPLGDEPLYPLPSQVQEAVATKYHAIEKPIPSMTSGLQTKW